MIKVSVVVPTYRSGGGLDRLVASLDAQTLPPSEFEVVFVDDGSPDDTHQRLLEVAATRPHVRVERIENSGWPCRPRNVGADLAQGEYVVFMDHDDLLYPDALRSAYDYAVANDADVVNGKESRTDDATWAIDTYRRDEPQSVGRTDQHPLIPMNPHKLYRRAFLDEHGIRFREGGRVLWEDIFFNLLVARSARVISTLASVPFYHWYTTPGSGSHGFLRSTPQFWEWLREVLVATSTVLAGEEFELQRRQLLLHQYRSRILASFDGRFARRPETERDLIYDACRSLQADFDLTRFDDELSRSAALRARLLHAGERELLEELGRHDPRVPGRVQVTDARWTDGRLELAGVAEWEGAGGVRHRLRRDGARVVTVLPAPYDECWPPSMRDVTAQIAGAVAEFGVRSQETRVTWMLPGTSRVEVSGDGDAVRFSAPVSAVLDPDGAVFGRPLERGVWEVNGRCTLDGAIQQERVHAAMAATATLVAGELRIAYVDPAGLLTLVLGGDGDGAALRHLLPVGTSAVDADGAARRARVPVRGVTVVGAGSARTIVELAPGRRRLAERLRGRDAFHPVPAQLVGDAEGVRLEFDLPSGADPVRLRLGDLEPGAPAWWTLLPGSAGTATLRPHTAPRRAERASWPRRLRRRAGRVLRRLGIRR
ncbi:glycosyltransferase family 2 protein [Microbacterium sp.]|uniref:glycosyltransferase family 2 protein n=1 Tax=Microbacterium sp. TaxID=51671 RepID=UPI0037CC3606